MSVVEEVEEAEEAAKRVERRGRTPRGFQRRIEEVSRRGESIAHLLDDLDDLEVDDELVDGLREITWAYLDQENFSEALEVLEKLAELNPGDLEVRIEIGKTHLRRGDPKEAFAKMETAFDFALRQSERERCEDILQLMERIDCDEAKTLVKRGELALADGEEDRALTIFEKAARMSENEGHRQDFLTVGMRILDLNPDDDAMRYKVAETLIAEARAYLDYQLYNKAIRKLCQAIKYTPEQVESYEMLAQVLGSVDRYQDAIDILVSASQRFDDPSRSRRLLTLARDLSACDEQIDVIADQLDEDLSEQDSDETLDPFPDDVSEELGDVETSVEYSATETQNNVAEHPGPQLSASPIESVVDLLKLIEQQDAPTRITVYDRDPVDGIEMLVSRGRLLPGIRIDGEYPNVADVGGEVTELRDDEKTSLDGMWQQAIEGSGEIPSLEGTDDRSEALRRRAVAILDVVRRRTEEATLRTSVMETAMRPRMSVSFSASSLLLEFGRRMARSLSSTDDETPLEVDGETSWCFCQIGDEKQYLPVRFEGRRSRPPLAQMCSTRELAASLGASMQKVGRTDDDEGPVAWSLVFEDAAWGAFGRDNFLWLTRVRTNQLGRMMRQFDEAIEGGKR